MAVSKKKEPGNTEQSAQAAARAAASAATPRATLTPGRKPQKGVLLNFRIDPIEKTMLEETFNQCGVTLSGGIKLAAYHAMQEIKAGRLVMTKAGLLPGR
ncbi:MAG: hypothetical protein FWD78_00215 [Treponema sp.]|nr:hypothetical protein [Treponema sp.]